MKCHFVCLSAVRDSHWFLLLLSRRVSYGRAFLLLLLLFILSSHLNRRKTQDVETNPNCWISSDFLDSFVVKNEPLCASLVAFYSVVNRSCFTGYCFRHPLVDDRVGKGERIELLSTDCLTFVDLEYSSRHQRAEHQCQSRTSPYDLSSCATLSWTVQRMRHLPKRSSRRAEFVRLPTGTDSRTNADAGESNVQLGTIPMSYRCSQCRTINTLYRSSSTMQSAGRLRR